MEYENNNDIDYQAANKRREERDKWKCDFESHRQKSGKVLLKFLILSDALKNSKDNTVIFEITKNKSVEAHNINCSITESKSFLSKLKFNG